MNIKYVRPIFIMLQFLIDLTYYSCTTPELLEIFAEAISNVGVSTAAIIDLSNSVQQSLSIGLADARLTEFLDANGLDPRPSNLSNMSECRDVQKLHLNSLTQELVRRGV
jgi:hypothetical protein